MSKVLFDGPGVDKNMGRLVAHELGHLLGAEHDQDVQVYYDQIKNMIMNSWIDINS